MQPLCSISLSLIDAAPPDDYDDFGERQFKQNVFKNDK